MNQFQLSAQAARKAADAADADAAAAAADAAAYAARKEFWTKANIPALLLNLVTAEVPTV